MYYYVGNTNMERESLFLLSLQMLSVLDHLKQLLLL